MNLILINNILRFLELQELKRQIITAIKMNKNLEQDLDKNVSIKLLDVFLKNAF